MARSGHQGSRPGQRPGLRLGIDLDGVVADFTTGWVTAYNQAFRAQVDPTDVRTWKAMVELTHFETASDFWRWARFGSGPSLFRSLDPYPGAIDTLHALARRHHVVIITSKPDWAVHDTLAWIAEHRLPTREIHVLSEKWRVTCDVYLEDRTHTLGELVIHHPSATVCRFARPWNGPMRGTVTVSSWPEFQELVESLPGR